MNLLRKVLGHCLLVSAAMASPVAAEEWIQTGAGPFSWIASGNWSPATVPNGVDAIANMAVNLSANQTVNLNQSITLGALTLGDTSSTANQFGLAINPNGAFNLVLESTGNATVTKVATTFNGVNDLISAPVVLNSNTVFSNGSSNSTDSRVEFTGIISGTGNLTIGGTGLVRLSSPNTYNGTTVLSTGRLQIGNATALQNSTVATNAGSGGLVFRAEEASDTFTFGGLSGDGNFALQKSGSGPGVNLLVGNNNADTTYSGVMSANGTLTKIGSGRLILSGNNTYTGVTNIRSGTLEVTATGAFGAGAITLNTASTGSSNTTLVFNSGSNTLGSGNSITVANEGTGITTISTGSSAVLPTIRALALNKDVTFDILANTSLRTDSPAAFSGAGNILKTGGGRLALNSTIATYTGNITISQGQVNWGATGSLGNGTVTINDASTGSVNTHLTSQNPGTLANSIVVANFGTGSVTLGTFNNSGGNATIYSGPISLGRSVTIAASRASGTTFSGNISGAGGITKTGAEILTLSGNNSYSGVTTISTGTLTLASSGSITSSSLITVASGATFNVGAVAGGWTLGPSQALGGSGTVAGNVTIQGAHAPGNSPGVQTFTSNLTYSGGNSTVQWELIGNTTTNTGNSTFDQIVVGGNLNFVDATTLNLVFNSANSTVLWSNAFWSSNQTWTLYDVAGTTTNSSSFSINSDSWLDSDGTPLASSVRAGSSFNLSQVGNDIVINYVAVPEPSTIVLACAGCVAAGLIARRRRRSGRL
jgi:autotransporter-associated beta strand protein